MAISRKGHRIGVLLLALVLAACGGGSGGEGEAVKPVLLPGTANSDAQAGGTGNPGPQDPIPEPPPDPEPETPPPPPPPPPAPVSCPMPAQCLDLGKAGLANWKGAKKAAASYTFDDGYDSSFAIADLFETRGMRASFYIVPTTVPEQQWTDWKRLSARGHEVGNHSLTHTVDLGLPELTQAQLEAEIVESRNIIIDKLGEKPQVFAFPWHSYSPASSALALSTHFAIRSSSEELPFTLAFFDQDHGTLQETLTTVNGQLRDVVASGGWFVAGGHGMDGDGWSPVTSGFLNTHLDYAQTFSSQLWVDTFFNVVRYQTCRKQAALKVDIVSSSLVTLELDGNFAAACTAPLTVTIPLLITGMPALLAYDVDGVTLPLKKIHGALTLDMLPGQKVKLQGLPANGRGEN